MVGSTPLKVTSPEGSLQGPALGRADGEGHEQMWLRWAEPRTGRWEPPQPSRALPQTWSEHKERPGMRMTSARRPLACPPPPPPSKVPLASPQANGTMEGGRAEHRAPVGNRWRVPKPPAPRHATAPSPGPRCHQETRDSCGPHAGMRSSTVGKVWRKREAGNVPTSLGVTPHGVRDPGT